MRKRLTDLVGLLNSGSSQAHEELIKIVPEINVNPVMMEAVPTTLRQLFSWSRC